jgi:hypothetical protein
MYENYKIYGPYLSKKDNRLRITLYNKDTHQKLSMSYPKYVMECYLNRHLTENETVDHIDRNPLNNDITNLQILDRSLHCYLDATRNQDIDVCCAYCGKQFTIKGNALHNRNRKDRHQSGYFCSRRCSGRYGRDIQLKRKSHATVEKVSPIKYKIKSA